MFNQVSMTHLNKLQVLKWVSSNSVFSWKISALPSLYCSVNNPRFYRRKKVVDCDNLGENCIDDVQCSTQFSSSAKKQAQNALLDYLHSTRSLEISDAEYMSKNSPIFLDKLLREIDTKEDIARSATRFLRYHPINEFEPFFESLGLSPHQYRPFLPRDLMFLSDDELLLENFRTLCNYGIPRNKIGKIYKEAGEVFRFDYGVLATKLQAYEKLGLERAFMGKVVVCNPELLIGDVNVDFVKSMEMLSRAGIKLCWIEQHLSENCSYNWGQLCVLLDLFSNTGYSWKQLGEIICQHPGIFFEGLGNRTLSLISFLVKFGSSLNHICSMFQEFPQMPVGKFLSNMRQCFLFLNEIEMERLEIGKFVRSYPLILGSCRLKKSTSLLSSLNTGKKRLCKIILQNPEEIKTWVIGSKVKPLPPDERLGSQLLKIKFLKDFGFVENSNEMAKALKVFRGKGAELQERFDCIMQAGLDKKDVCEIVRQYPQILNQKKEVIEMKIDVLVNDLGYPMSSLCTFPSFLCYTIPTVKLRLAMYNWLKDQRKVDPLLSLSTLISVSDKVFVKRYVEPHPKGPKVWENLKKKIGSE